MTRRLKEYRVPVTNCFGCGNPNDAATNVLGTDNPEPGDVTICLRCGMLMRFRKNMTLRQLTGKEMIEALQDPRVSHIERTRQEVMKGQKH
jgi:hypothetical protein